MSIIVAVKMVGPHISELPRFVFWNLHVAMSFIEAGWLPMCIKCELVSLLLVMIYGFVIGFLGYSPILFAIFYLQKVWRTKS